MTYIHPTISVRHASFSYGAARVIDRLSLDLFAGEVTAIRGSNGSGKSTLLQLMSGTLSPSAGTVTRPKHPRIAVVFQRSRATDALPLTVMECVRIGLTRPRTRWQPFVSRDQATVQNTLEALEIGHLRRRRLRELSGGQRQRVLIAQALVQDADALLLDEPTAGLDAAASELITAQLHARAAAGMAVMHITHEQSTAAQRRDAHLTALHLDDRVITLAGGRVLNDVRNS